jgi:hypothetical protein
MTDIEKVLISQKKTDLRTILSDHYHEFLNVFNHTMTEKLSLKRRKHRSSNWTKKMNEKRIKSTLRFSIQYDRETTSVAKTLTELLNKQFIQVSNFMLQCQSCLYRSQKMNFSSVWTTVTKLNHSKNHYSFILIYETLQNIKQAQWYIKLNVIVAFHKIQIAAEDKWKMAFCIRYELYKWMMTSFELVNVSSTFQIY